MIPKLTIGIPHLDRTPLLKRAIDFCFKQTEPVQIIVADQGHTDETAELMNGYAQLRNTIGGFRIDWFQSPAKCLQDNWLQAASACDTPYFAWLQDDDILTPFYAKRVVEAFESHPNAMQWMGRLETATKELHPYWYSGNGPWMPMQPGSMHEMDGAILAPSSYFTSWALSPAVAFRCGKHFQEALGSMPLDCAIFAERLFPAFMGQFGTYLVDRYLAGYWILHEKNESPNQWPDQPRQTAVMITEIDKLMEKLPEGWKDKFRAWIEVQPVHFAVQWLNNMNTATNEGKPSKHIEEVGGIMLEALKGKIAITSVEQPSRPRSKRWFWPFPQIEFRREPLYDIALRHGTDKEYHHHYTQHYERLFEPLRTKPVTLLEIGVGGYEEPAKGGESLRMWRDYFKQGRIYGIDIIDKSPHNEARIKTFKGSQDDKEFLQSVITEIGAPDIVIDDGSHESEPTIATFELLWDVLKPGGIYVIEDTRTSYRAKYGGSLRKEDEEQTAMGWFKRLADHINGAEWIEADTYGLTVQSVEFVTNLVIVRKHRTKQYSIAGRPAWVKV